MYDKTPFIPFIQINNKVSCCIYQILCVLIYKNLFYYCLCKDNVLLYQRKKKYKNTFTDEIQAIILDVTSYLTSFSFKVFFASLKQKQRARKWRKNVCWTISMTTELKVSNYFKANEEKLVWSQVILVVYI